MELAQGHTVRKWQSFSSYHHIMPSSHKCVEGGDQMYKEVHSGSEHIRVFYFLVLVFLNLKKFLQ